MSATRTVMQRAPVLLAAALLLGGCAGQAEQAASPTGAPATPDSATPTVVLPVIQPTAATTVAPPTPEPSPSPAAAGQTPVVSCEPTQPDQLGPFYVPGAPERSSVGQGHVLSGVVRSSTDCTPVAGAQIEFWMAGPNGQYDDNHRATQFADAAGAYRFESNFPPPYSGRPSHIHVRVSADGYETLVTQYYPAGGQTEGTFDLVLVPVAPTDTSANALALPTIQEYPVPAGSRPHDVAPAPDGTVWYTAQGSGELGRLDPGTGETHHIPLGPGSAPHGVIVGPDGAAWVTDSGLNALVRVDPETETTQVFSLPAGRGNANLNTATFDGAGVLWFTGQNGIFGRLDPAAGQVEVFDAPRGRGPYGIDSTPDGVVYYASLAGSHIARIDAQTNTAIPIEPPTSGQGARRVWSDSQGRLWVSEWNAGQLGLFDPATSEWREWRVPGDNPMPYAVYVDDRDIVWLSDFGANALVRFDPQAERFEVFGLPSSPASVRQILGRPGEVWGAESGVDKLVVLRMP